MPSDVAAPAICPGCAAAAPAVAGAAPKDARIVLSVPGVHCQTCITKIEQGLAPLPGVRSARVNLTLKRVLVDATADVTPADVALAVNDLGFEAHELDGAALDATETDAAGRELLMRMAVAGFAAMNVMLLSVSVWAGASDATRDMFHWISAAITLPAVAFSAQPFFRNAWTALSAGRLNMDVPISLAILLALVTSLWETALSGEHAYFDAAIALTFFLLAGRYLDHRTRAAARSAAKELTALEVPRAHRVVGGVETDVPVADLNVGDVIIVRPGGRIPVDGEITEGRSERDRSVLTGETLPVLAVPGAMVSAGEVNLTGPLTIRATAVGADTSLHRLADLVAVSESGRSRYTSLADKAAKLYAPGVHILSALSFIGWYVWSGDVRTALNIAAAVLIITCPCALGLAVPAVTTAASGRLFRRGLLIKDGTALERLAEVDTVVFDKTGTLTTGAPELTNLGDHTQQALSVAHGLAAGSAHPLSRAIAMAAQDAGVQAVGLEDVVEFPGYGTQAIWNGRRVRLGRGDWVGAPDTDQTACWLSIDGDAPVPFYFSDTLRDGATALVEELKGGGYHVALLSGDTRTAVAAFAARIGIDDAMSEALPDDKAARMASLAQAGRKVLMVGDGLNDTAALAGAHVSISPATALDAARTASDIVLLNRDLSPIVDALATSKKATQRIRENFRIATLYNIVAVPLAVAGLATPLIAALAMSLSSVTVSLNAIRLR